MMVFGSSSNEQLRRAEQYVQYPDALRPDIRLLRVDNPYGNFESCWWPKSGFYGDVNTDGGLLDPIALRWDLMTQDGWSGGRSRKLGALTAIVRDRHGSPVDGASCNLIRNSDNRIVDTGVTDASGNVRFMVNELANTHRIVAKSGIAETQQGVSANTIVGT